MTDKFYLSGEDMAKEPYHYKTCGLEGIYLLNGYIEESIDGEEYVSIKDTDGLHRIIGKHLVLNRKVFTPKEIKFLRNVLDLTQSELASRLGNTSQSVARWEKGEYEMPGTADKLLRLLYLLQTSTDQEIEILKSIVFSKFEILDKTDEVDIVPAQFELFDNWTDTTQKLVA